MSEKSPKRGILSSLMGLFGDDAENEADQEREAAKGPESVGNGSPPPPEPAPEQEPEPQETGNAPVPGESVVRESYEPGWYAVSTARTSRPTFVSEPWGGSLPP